MSATRRAGSDFTRLFENSVDPPAELGALTIYPKAFSGVTHLFVVVSDGTIYQLTPPTGDALSISRPNGDVALIKRGMPVVLSAGGDLLRGAANAALTAPVIGLARNDGLPTETITVQVLGAVTLPTAEWDALTGAVGGLTLNSTYYLSLSLGMLTITPPIIPGQYVVEIGRAITSDTLLVQVESPVLL